jgi:hypothetical protein
MTPNEKREHKAWLVASIQDDQTYIDSLRADLKAQEDGTLEMTQLDIYKSGEEIMYVQRQIEVQMNQLSVLD